MIRSRQRRARLVRSRFSRGRIGSRRLRDKAFGPVILIQCIFFDEKALRVIAETRLPPEPFYTLLRGDPISIDADELCVFFEVFRLAIPEFILVPKQKHAVHSSRMASRCVVHRIEQL